MVSTAARWHGGCLLVKAATSPGLEDGPMIGEILLLMAGTIPVAAPGDGGHGSTRGPPMRLRLSMPQDRPCGSLLTAGQQVEEAGFQLRAAEFGVQDLEEGDDLRRLLGVAQPIVQFGDVVFRPEPARSLRLGLFFQIAPIGPRPVPGTGDPAGWRAVGRRPLGSRRREDRCWPASGTPPGRRRSGPRRPGLGRGVDRPFAGRRGGVDCVEGGGVRPRRVAAWLVRFGLRPARWLPRVGVQ